MSLQMQDTPPKLQQPRLIMQPNMIVVNCTGDYVSHQLVNQRYDRVFYEIKCDNPQFYRIHPCAGFLNPGQRMRLRIVREKGSPSEDEILVQYGVVPNRDVDCKVAANRVMAAPKTFRVPIIAEHRDEYAKDPNRPRPPNLFKPVRVVRKPPSPGKPLYWRAPQHKAPAKSSPNSALMIKPNFVVMDCCGDRVKFLLANPSTRRHVFKVKFSEPRLYRIDRVSGFVNKGSALKLEVTRLPGSQSQDELYIQFMSVPDIDWTVEEALQRARKDFFTVSAKISATDKDQKMLQTQLDTSAFSQPHEFSDEAVHDGKQPYQGTDDEEKAESWSRVPRDAGIRRYPIPKCAFDDYDSPPRR